MNDQVQRWLEQARHDLVDLPDGEQAIFLTASAIDAIKKEILNIVSVSDAEQPDKDELNDQH